MFIYLSMGPGHWTVGHNTEIPCLSFFGITKHCLPSDPVSCDIHTSQGILVNSISLFTCTAVSGWNEDKNGPTRLELELSLTTFIPELIKRIIAVISEWHLRLTTVSFNGLQDQNWMRYSQFLTLEIHHFELWFLYKIG